MQPINLQPDVQPRKRMRIQSDRMYNVKYQGGDSVMMTADQLRSLNWSAHKLMSNKRIVMDRRRVETLERLLEANESITLMRTYQ